MNTNDIGSIAEIKTASKYMENGYNVSIPLNQGSPYDLLCDSGNDITRIQVKSAKMKDGYIEANLHTRYQKEGEWVSTTHDETTIDKYALYCPSNDKLYTIPVEEAPKYNIRLRVESIDGGRSRWADDYKLTVENE